MINRDLRQFVNESYIKDDFDIIQEALIEEGATMDLYHLLKDIQHNHNSRLNNMYNKLADNDVKGAKEDINVIIKNLEKAKAEVSRIDDSAFADKLGSSVLKIMTFIGKIGMEVLGGFAGGVAADAAANKVLKTGKKTLTKDNLKFQAVSAVVMALPSIIKTMQSETQTIEKRKALIKQEMEKGASEAEAKKKVGSIYKVSILQYINSQIKDMRKIQVNMNNVKPSASQTESVEINEDIKESTEEIVDEKVGDLLDPKANIEAIKDIFKKHKEKKEKERKEAEAKKKQEKENKDLQRNNKNLLDEYNKLPASEKAKVRKLAEKAEDEFEKIAKIELRKLMNDPKFKASIRKEIDDAFEDGKLDKDDYKEFYNTNKLPKTHVYNGGDYWQIIDEDQEICIVCSSICYELAKILEEKTGYSIGTGDGDEGCIYPYELDDILYFYKQYKKENNNKEK